MGNYVSPGDDEPDALNRLLPTRRAMKDLFGQPMTRVRKTKRWKPEGVTIFVYAPILAAYEPIRTPIVGNKLETKYAAVDTDRVLHLVAESEQFGLNAVALAKRFAKVGFTSKCYIGGISEDRHFRTEAAIPKRTAAEKRRMKKLGIRD